MSTLDQEIADLEKLLEQKITERNARFVFNDQGLRQGLHPPSGDELARDANGFLIGADPLVKRRLVGGPDEHSAELRHQHATLDRLERIAAAQRRGDDDSESKP